MDTCVKVTKKLIDLKDCILYRMGFQQKYTTAEKRLVAQREQKNTYSKKPYCCPNCKVTIMLGNKWKPQRTKKHMRSMEIPKTDE